MRYLCKDTAFYARQRYFAGSGIFKNILKKRKNLTLGQILLYGLYFCLNFLHHYNTDNKYGKYPKHTRQRILHTVHLYGFVFPDSAVADAVQPQQCT